MQRETIPKTYRQEIRERAEILYRDAEEYSAMLRIVKMWKDNGNADLLENMYRILPDILKYDQATDLCEIIKKLHGCYTEIKAAAT